MALVPQPMIDNLTLDLQRDVANAIVTISFNVNWTEFARNTNLAYTEVVKLVGKDILSDEVLWTGPILANGISSNGEKTTHREHVDTIAWSALDENPTGEDHIAAEVTLIPRLPATVTRQSEVLVVEAP